MAKKRAASTRRAIEPRQPSDPFAPFDPHTFGCVLPGVALKKSCAEMRSGKFYCPKWRAFKKIDGAGNMVGIEWACDEKWKLDMLAELNGRTVAVQKAVETRGDLQREAIAGVGERIAHLNRCSEETVKTLHRIEKTAPAAADQLAAPDSTTALPKPNGVSQAG